MLTGSSSRVGCCVILQLAVLSRVLMADVFDTSVRGEEGGRDIGTVFGFFSSTPRLVSLMAV